MEAFNVPYSVLDPNSALGNLTFIKTSTYSPNTAQVLTHTVTGDICLIDINFTVADQFTTGNFRCPITSLKSDSFNAVHVYTKTDVSKNGATITINQLYYPEDTRTVVTIYEFNFA
jgi:hypothetical protein